MLGYKFRGLTAVNRRKDRRIPVSIRAEISGKSALIKDISLGGLGFVTNKVKFNIGDDILVELNVADIGSVKIGASVVRAKDTHEYGAAFLGLSSNAFRLIETLELGQYRRRNLKVA